jgi:mono/diheme cytochrome c family protein
VARVPLPAGRKKRIALYVAAALIGLFAVAQAVPYGRGHSNPPVTNEPAWDSPQTRALAVRACFDCHSNRTNWPWYSNIAPVSWLVQRDVDDGRSTLDFSRWDRAQDAGVGDIVEAVNGGGMPPWYYKLLHSRSRLSQAEKAQLVAGLQKTLRTSPPVGGGG